MQDFFNKAGKVSQEMRQAEPRNKAGDMVEIGKLKAKISAGKSGIVSAKKRKSGSIVLNSIWAATADRREQ